MVRGTAVAALMLLGGPHAVREEMTAGAFTTLPQRNRLAGPFDGPSARVSAGGRYVVFASHVPLVPDDTNHVGDIYTFDLATARLTLESAGPDGASANGESVSPAISGNGRYVVFVSIADNLVDPKVPPAVFRVYLRDRETGTTRLLSTSMDGRPANGDSTNPAISADGTTVVFESTATDLVPQPPGFERTISVYWMRWASGERARVDLTSSGHARPGQGASPSLSADGRYVAFMSKADLTCSDGPSCASERADTNRLADIYLRDMYTGMTRRLSVTSAGRDGNGPSSIPAISADGRYVAFVSRASNLTRDARSEASQIFVRDTLHAVTTLVSRDERGRPGDGASTSPAISADGTVIAFQSLASNLACRRGCRAGEQDSNLIWDVYVRDGLTGRVSRVSMGGPDEWMEISRAPSLDAGGRLVVFTSRHPRDASDDGHDEDVFIRPLDH